MEIILLNAICVDGKPMESQQEEWKSDWKDDYLKTVCAFASDAGGRFVIGKADDGRIVGVPNAKKLMESIPCTISNLMNFLPRIEAFTEEGKTYLVLTIEPQHKAVDLRGSFYKRSGSTTVRVTDNELRAFVMEKEGVAWTDLISKKATLSDISPEAVSMFIKRGQEAKRISSAVDPDDIEGVLRHYKLLTDKGLTNAGALLFSNDAEHVSRAAVTKIGLFSKSRSRLLMDDMFEGPIIFQPDEVMKCLVDRYIQPRYDIEGVYRVVKHRYPLDAIREALTNSILHRQYMAIEHTTIRVYPDSVEIYNPGSLPKGWTADELPEKHESIPANPLIAKAFFDMGLVETWGVGMSLIQDECRNAGIPQPTYEVDGFGVRIIFRSGPWPYDGGEIKEPPLIEGLTPLEMEIYKAIAEGTYTTAEGVAITLESSVRTVKRATYKLRDMGFIRRIGSDKKGSWETVSEKDL